LDIQDSLVPANLGLRDQRLALVWVRKNVQFFGGDPENVSLAGSSAGASSVALHMLTDTSRKIYHL
jgi:carboxylesterase type B